MEKPNQSYIDRLSSGNESFKNKLISVIKNEFPDEKKNYFKNINAKKYKEAAENVHKIKHKISILGLVEGYETAILYENNLKEGDITLKDKFDIILSVISEYLTTL